MGDAGGDAGGDGGGGDSAGEDSGEPEDSGGGGEESATLVPWGDGPVSCADPSARDSLGAGAYSDDEDGLADVGMWETDFVGTAMGLAVGDIDGDGILDVVHARPEAVVLFLGDGDGSFSAAVERPFPGGTGLHVAAALLFDVDDDGDLDLLITHRGDAPLLYRNDGVGGFALDADAGLPTAALAQLGAAAADGDGDGDLDVIIGAHHTGPWSSEAPPTDDPAVLLENVDGRFVDRSDALPASLDRGYTFVTAWFDLDGDGDPDPYLLNDHGPIGGPNQVAWNDSAPGAWAFTGGDGTEGLSLVMNAMGLGLGDLNADGLPDLLLSNWGPPRLLESSPGGWFEGARVRGITDSEAASVGWGTQFGDLDNDGDLDAAMAFGYLNVGEGETRPNADRQPDRVWLQGGDGVFEEVAAAWGLDADTHGRALILADLDHNGFLDVVTAPQNAPPRAWLGRCDDRAWLMVDLDQPAPNVDAVGARIVLTSGAQVWTRWVVAGGTGFGGSGPLRAHFGLGELDEVDDLMVIWPDGERSHLGPVATRQGITVRRR